MSWLYSLLSPTLPHGNNPALFVLDKAELSVLSCPSYSQHLQGTVQLSLLFLQPSYGRAEQSAYRSACCGDVHPHLLRSRRSGQPFRAKARCSSGSCWSAGSTVKRDSTWWFILDTWNIIASLLVL